MTIAWTQFTPLPSLMGGILIGIAAAILALCNGRIAGISGILGGLLRPRSNEVAWRVAFISGLILAPLLYRFLSDLPAVEIEANGSTIVVAGLLVGLGTRYGAGCTSGHGICGLSRLSPRSAVATVAFMLGGVSVVFVVRHVLS
jgi:uncharacterized membrane protein YedE/YeeE